MSRPIRTEIMGCSVYCMTDDPMAAQLWEELTLREPIRKTDSHEENPYERMIRIHKERELMLPITNRNNNLNRLLKERSFEVNMTIVYRGCTAERMVNDKGQFHWWVCQRENDMASVVRGVVEYGKNSEVVVCEYDGDIPMDEKTLEDFVEELYNEEFDPTVISKADCDYIVYREHNSRVEKLIEESKNERWLLKRVG